MSLAQSQSPTRLNVRPVAHSKLRANIEIPDPLVVELEGDAPLPVGFGRIRILSEEDGDKRVVWNSLNMEDIRAAKELFAKLQAEGMDIYCVGIDGNESSKRMTEFDPTAEVFVAGKAEVLAVPRKAVVGG